MKSGGDLAGEVTGGQFTGGLPSDPQQVWEEYCFPLPFSPPPGSAHSITTFHPVLAVGQVLRQALCVELS